LGRKALMTKEITQILARLSTDRNGNFKKTPAIEVENELKWLVKTGALKLDGRLPGLATIYKELENIKDNFERNKTDPDTLDGLWSIASCSKFPELFPRDCILELIHYQKSWESAMEDEQSKPLFTIRFASWVARLLPLVKATASEPVEVEILVLSLSSAYSTAEFLAHVLGIEFDSSELDSAYFKAGPLTWDGFYNTSNRILGAGGFKK
jgi:hypothetical protein